MSQFSPSPPARLNRRSLFKAALCGASGLALYSTAVARHWVEVTQSDVHLRGLAPAFQGMRVVQLTDIHMDEFTEPFFLRDVVRRINHLKPDMVLLTGDYVSYGISSKQFALGAAWQCANLLAALDCPRVFAVLGNHDLSVDANEVTHALTANGIKVLNNQCHPITYPGGRFWLAGLDDPMMGDPDPEAAIPTSIRNLPHEPVILMCHTPDYADDLLQHPAGKAVDLMLSGHTHGGQIRLPLLGALELPDMGKKYVEGWFQFGRMKLYVNRGIGTVGVPFRFDCPPEISVFTLKSA